MLSDTTAPAEGLQDKLTALEQLLLAYGRVAIGFSGGVDSSFLAAVCARIMPASTLLVHLTTPLIGFLRKKYPNARIDALVYHSTREMLTGNPDLDNVYTIDQKWKKMGVKKQLGAEINLLKKLKANRSFTSRRITAACGSPAS